MWRHIAALWARNSDGGQEVKQPLNYWGFATWPMPLFATIQRCSKQPPSQCKHGRGGGGGLDRGMGASGPKLLISWAGAVTVGLALLLLHFYFLPWNHCISIIVWLKPSYWPKHACFLDSGPLSIKGFQYWFQAGAQFGAILSAPLNWQDKLVP